uniref:Tetraacyldisaccharide 4'-kinase n=1 Tax=Candidatus Kentrum sp. MB TaxID=2138164 RepID=A0A451BE73_9GAMM|nr:MAG: lipid-A-disaccharide kinase [Candidatus Kentron sp. MB]VFK76580.1 MAG: lipid-A-disaccharide kinase [Candidatus Kentron sp. MB]
MFSPRLFFPRVWYTAHHPLGYALAPFSRLFCLAVSVRRFAYRQALFKAHHPGVPVVVVGNITTGGTGKTPLVVWLAHFLRRHGFRPAIVVRGYGGKAEYWPQWVNADTDPYLVGDEAVLLARRADCRVMASPDRVAATNVLPGQTNCNLILCDDGLQHYALARDVEIAVVDGDLGVGNGRCLPAGPLREPVSRLAEVDLVVRHTRGDEAIKPGVNPLGRTEYHMRLVPGALRAVTDERIGSLEVLKKMPVHAVCGIGHPERFFGMLRALGFTIRPHAFPDHHAFRAEELAFGDGLPILMTEKDAVKCHRFAKPNHWYLPVDAELDPALGVRLLQVLGERRH